MIPEEASFKVGEVDIHFRTCGEGPPLVLLHGFFQTGRIWEPLFASLADEFQLIVPDLRGHGRSTNPSKVFTHGQAAQDIYALLDSLGINHFRAIGYSSGSMTLLHMATQQLERVESMLLFCPTTYFPEQSRNFNLGFSTLDKADPAWVQELRASHAGGDEQIQTLFDNFRTFALNHSDMDFTPAKLSAITARTLIVHGDRDEFFPIDIPVDLYRSIPDAGLWILPYAAHVGLLEKLAQSTSAEAATELKLPLLAMEFLRERQGA